MKEVLGSLPEVITAYKNYNLLVPTATDVQLNPFYKFHVEEVPVDLGENSGDIFKVGSVKTGKQDEKGKDIWEDVFSLSKPLLNKMAMAAGIQFNPKETYGERIDRVTYRAQAQGAMRKADGTARTETDEMERGCKASGVKKIRVHDLRHSHVSLLINMGYTALAIGKRVGHSAEKITYRYAHLFPSVQQDMAEQLDAENMDKELNEVEGGLANVG